MPTYEYHCRKCGKNFEKVQKISDTPIKKCESCGGKAERLISQTSFSLKGSGWYKDGYAKTKTGEKSEGSKGKGEGHKVKDK